MPIFEYICQSCGKPFEKLVNPGQTVSCPACQSKDIEKQLSLFAVSKAAGDSLPDCRAADCGFEAGGCGSGMCGHHHD